MHNQDNNSLSTNLSGGGSDNALPAILIGGVPNAGKSVLTYNLTQKLRAQEVPHYVLRANPDGEGDWSMKGWDSENVRLLRKQAHQEWSDTFRELVSQAIRNRRLPLIVDIGGSPREADIPILDACTHTILLLKDGEEQANEKWRYYTERTGLTLFAELRSDLNGTSELTERIPVIRGTIAGLNSDKALRCEVFEALIERIKNLFGPFNDAELEKMHMGQVPNNTTSISLTRELRKFGRKQAEWNTNLLKRFLPNVSTQYPLALYGRGPSWLYGVLALHAGTQQPFHQFDPRFKKGWIQALKLETSDTFEISQGAITLEQHVHKDTWMLTVLLKIGYIDYELDMQQLVFPKPPAGYGVIIDGKLPLWLFTSLARLYAGLEVPWIAFNDANTDQTDRAFVIYSKVPQYYSIGSRVPLLA